MASNASCVLRPQELSGPRPASTRIERLKQDGFAADQQVDIPTQLGLGVRLLQAQAHVNDGVLHFCHTSCLLFDGGTVEDYLNKVHDFLTANPNEVLTLLFTNPEGASLPDLWDPPFQASGIADLAYVPPSIPVKQSDWPTLGDLIDSGKRVIVFLDAGADTDRSVPYILPEFEMVWETPFSVTDATFPCSVDRINGPLSTEDHMYMINHSLNKNILDTGIIVSDPKDAPTTNSVSSILANAGGCEGFAAGRAPNFVLLDFVNLGQGLDAVNQLNGLAIVSSFNILRVICDFVNIGDFLTNLFSLGDLFTPILISRFFFDLHDLTTRDPKLSQIISTGHVLKETESAV
ncbi:PLC-like phosphodiesterase [Dichomitus squalens LYAD-421 SS1]|uniref:PLC-like phosphodiesterase n=1 Tax=Dichomitus squalens (strain LYAD-421) TaxID=732165 RepID=UPI0004410CB7|nr:PLC-like phosphodiesterase [Dichomitus squalens LYAD-421 SS1]EJF63689.1 PLC-like phosphodiesterase [Dichomitus squalens LYAD-421 SS1]